MLLLFIYFPKILPKKNISSESFLKKHSGLVLTTPIPLLVLLLCLTNVNLLFKVLSVKSQTTVQEIDTVWKKIGLFPSIVIRNKNIVVEKPDKSLIQSYLLSGKEITGSNMDDLKLRFTKGIDLSNRNLIYAIFENCEFTNADFRNANLQGSKFIKSTYLGAEFFNAKVNGAFPEKLYELSKINNNTKGD